MTGDSQGWFQHLDQLLRTHWVLEQGVFPILVFTGWGVLTASWLKRKKFKEVFFIGFSLLPYLLFSTMTFAGAFLPRTTSLVIPMAALCAGAGLQRLHAFAENKWPALARYSFFLTFLAVLTLTAQGAWRQWHHGITRSGYSQASRYLASTGDRQFFFLSMEPVWRFYLGRAAYDPYHRPHNFQTLVETGKKAGVRRLAIDYGTLLKYDMDYTRKLLGKVTPEKEFENPRARKLAYLPDDDFTLEKAQEIVRDPAVDKIYIYRISDIAAALASGRIQDAPEANA